MAAPLAYVHLDHNDRAFFDHALASDAHRFAFIKFMEHVEDRYAKNKRPRTGNGRIKLWNKSSRTHWIRRAQQQVPLPPILRPTWNPPSVPLAPPALSTAIEEQTAPPTSHIATSQSPPLALLAPIQSSAVPTSTAVARSPPLTLTVPVPSATVEIVPHNNPSLGQTLSISEPRVITEILPNSPHHGYGDQHPAQSAQSSNPQTIPTGTKRAFQPDDNHGLRPPVKRARTDIGGERAPQFVHYNNLEKGPHGDIFFLAPTRDQRQFIQERLGSEWRYVKTLRQSSTKNIKGFPLKSVFLFVQIDEYGTIRDRVVVKYRNISDRKDVQASEIYNSVNREEEAAMNVLPITECNHLQQYRSIGAAKSAVQNFHFKLQGDGDDTDTFKLHYMFTNYAPHGDLDQLVRNHARKRKIVPEHFCWFVFGSLVDALIACQKGSPSHQINQDPTYGHEWNQWRPLLHLDIHPGNVLLYPESSGYDYYKQPVLGDFDMAMRLHRDHKMWDGQFKDSRFRGTPFWQAPEMCVQEMCNKKYPPAKWDLSGSTDIYALGLLIRYLMIAPIDPYGEGNLRELEVRNFAREASKGPKDQEYRVSNQHFPGEYSNALIRTVQTCLAFRPVQDRARPDTAFRPTLYQLRDRIRDNMARLERYIGSHLGAAQQDPQDPLCVLFTQDEDVAIGSEFKPVNTVSLSDLIIEANDEEKAEAWMNWTDRLQTQQESRPEVHPDAMQKVLDDVYAPCREEILGLQTAGMDRELLTRALDHARHAITRCTRPDSERFKQVQSHLNEAFCAPERKYSILRLLGKHCQNLLMEQEEKVEKISAAKHEREKEMEIVMTAKIEAENKGDENSLRKAEARINFLYTKEELKAAEEEFAQEVLYAIKTWSEAIAIFLEIIVLGYETKLGDEYSEDHWIPKMSRVHLGLWEYLWIRPDGVPKDPKIGSWQGH